MPSAMAPLVVGLALLIGAAGPLQAATPATAGGGAQAGRGDVLANAGESDNFGRLLSRAQRCRNNLAEAAPFPCTSVLFEQPSQGVLNIRFLSPGPQGGGSAQLNFVGVLAPPSTPMACDQGRCRLVGPVTTTVSSMSERTFDDRGLASGLPKAWPAQGSCSIERRLVRCSAKAPGQEAWNATAEF